MRVVINRDRSAAAFDVRFAPLCGPKSDVPHSQRRAKCGHPACGCRYRRMRANDSEALRDAALAGLGGRSRSCAMEASSRCCRMGMASRTRTGARHLGHLSTDESRVPESEGLSGVPSSAVWSSSLSGSAISTGRMVSPPSPRLRQMPITAIVTVNVEKRYPSGF